MNELIKNLHTAIRQYCIDRHSFWIKKYDEITAGKKWHIGNSYSKQEHLIFSRYNVLSAILFEIERYRIEEFTNFEEARNLFCLAIEQAESIFTTPPKDTIQQQVINEERKLLIKFIESLTEEELFFIKPLFYRRVLTVAESATIWQKLQVQWNIAYCDWYPLNNNKPENVEAFQNTYFTQELGGKKLRKVLQKHDVKLIWELREDKNNYEMELSVFDPYYNGAEGFWCDSNFGWIIYASHESSITIGGWLLAEIQAIWPNWSTRVWTTPFFN